MALNNQPAVLKVVDEKVYFTLQYSPGTPATATTPATAPTYSSTVNTVPVGVVMNVIPQISDTQQVSLTVRPTISRIVGYKADPAVRLATQQQVENLVPEIQVRELESTLQLASGQVAVLGGLIQDNVQTQRDGVPGLSRLPWGLGDLFSYRNDQAGKTELVIFIRPVIVNQAGVDGDLADHRRYLPGADFFTRPEDELSAFHAGLPVHERKSP
jgi:general secretion pathway protein D